MANIDEASIEAGQRLGLFSSPLSGDQMAALRKSVVTASRYLEIVERSADGISQSALSDALEINLNTVGAFTRLLSRLGLITADRQASAVGCSYIIYRKR